MKNHLFKGIPTESPNGFVIRAAGRCYRAGLTPARAVTAIEAYKPNPPFYRPFKQGEVSRAVKRAYNTQAVPGSQGGGSAPNWPTPDPVLQRKVIASNAHATLEALQQSSPEPLDQEIKAILEKLFPGDPLLCISQEFDSGTITLPLSAFDHAINRRLLQAPSFIVPSPMAARLGKTQEGKLSAHCLENTGPRRFLIVEIDDKTISKDQQAALINHLAGFAPLVAVVDSAGKSLHAVFYVEGATEEQGGVLQRFFAHAVALGADPRMWTRSQFTRMPNGTRRITGGVQHEPRRQNLVYFNPNNRRIGSPVPQL